MHVVVGAVGTCCSFKKKHADGKPHHCLSHFRVRFRGTPFPKSRDRVGPAAWRGHHRALQPASSSLTETKGDPQGLGLATPVTAPRQDLGHIDHDMRLWGRDRLGEPVTNVLRWVR